MFRRLTLGLGRGASHKLGQTRWRRILWMPRSRPCHTLTEPISKGTALSSLRETFVSVSVRESAGGRTGERYQYQWNWALAHLLELHKKGEDYLVAFDYHDDVIDFDSASEPTSIRFYQVKTREKGGWTLAKLLYRARKTKDDPNSKAEYLLSAVGKMYHNKILFPEHTKLISFVTNAPLELSALPGRNPRKLNANDLHQDALTRIATQLRDEHGLSAAPDVGNLMLFEQCPLTLEDHAVQLKGRLAGVYKLQVGICSWHPRAATRRDFHPSEE